MKSLIALYQVILRELGIRCGTSTKRDLKTVTSRFEHEGESFYTISLPAFGKGFEKSLDLGHCDPSQFQGYAFTGGLPRLFGGFLDQVFDRKTGRLLSDPSIEAIRAVRQLTLAFGKVLLRCSESRTYAALRGFIECEQDVRKSDRRLIKSESGYLDQFDRVSRLLWADYLSAVDTRIYHEGVLPKHGKGATADKLRGNAKYNNQSWTSRLEAEFPHWEYLIPSESFLQRVDGANILEPGDEVPVRVTPVPKTLKTPRIIAIEPTCMQYMQQGVLSVMVEQAARCDNTRHLVSSESQEPNQRLAREGSITGALATLDLSEASDRVSNQHVRLLLKNHRWLRSAVDATRSRKADVLGQTIRLAKFASMGSALCFPFEAMVFATVVFVGIERSLNRRLSARDVQSFYGRVRVYGDDIIVPVEHVLPVVEALEAFGLRVNADKSFWTGKFRESCGKDYYDGHDVSIVRFRRTLPRHRRDVEELNSAVSLRNQLFQAGYDEVVEQLDERIQRIIPFPFVEATSALMGRHAYSLPSQEMRVCPDYQVPLVKGAVIRYRLPDSRLDDYGALMKWFLKPGDIPFQDKDHLLRAGRPVSARIKTRWATVD
ncbi:TPA_asm: RNA-directed RNA polymerase [ssRNA phage Zoerhiza.1_30]|uniref:RNA-directed RNA polymerase n=2 Tax=Leviviricetes TaxID=2842243 RepID=A0A8S5L4C4_9VIRU|nr:RNA-directed RNA polymerase [ssRNA phage Zoerhiza.1_30]QDH90590.1 MAG: RNA-dependent RNA polymerase [Leviviridae sp.]DAD52189.1 TPA_asm: RNA-directed RNA polymerase [ssRNA phage Zoerhiza.1_30]